MADDTEMTVGEIGRSVERIEASVTELRKEMRERYHTLTNQVNVAIGPLSVHTMQIANLEKQLERLDTDVKDVTKQANRIAGAGALLAIVAGLLPLPWKR